MPALYRFPSSHPINARAHAMAHHLHADYVEGVMTALEKDPRRAALTTCEMCGHVMPDPWTPPGDTPARRRLRGSAVPFACGVCGCRVPGRYVHAAWDEDAAFWRRALDAHAAPAPVPLAAPAPAGA